MAQSSPTGCGNTTDISPGSVRQMAEMATVAVRAPVKSACAATLSTPVLRILVILPGGIVDFLFTLPALRALRESFPGARICAVAAEALLELAQQSADLDDVWVRARQGISSQAVLWRNLREGHFDLAVTFSSSRHSTLLAFGSGAPRRVGFADARWGHLLTHQACREDVPAMEAYLRLVQSIGCRMVQADYRGLLIISPTRLQEVDAWLAQNGIKSTFAVVALHKIAHKNTPQQRWERTIALLAAKMPVVLVGMPHLEHLDLADALVHHFQDSSSWSLLAALCVRAQTVVSADASLLHVAACLNTPVVGVGDSPDNHWGLPAGAMYRLCAWAEEAPGQIALAVEEVIHQKSEV